MTPTIETNGRLIPVHMHDFLSRCIIRAGYVHGLGIGLVYDFTDALSDATDILFIDTRGERKVVTLPLAGAEIFQEINSTTIIAEWLHHQFDDFVLLTPDIKPAISNFNRRSFDWLSGEKEVDPSQDNRVNTEDSK